MASTKTAVRTLLVDDIQRSEWNVIAKEHGISVRPNLRLAGDMGIPLHEVVIHPDRACEFADLILDVAEEGYGTKVD
jgi:hypothetical protein